jgi:hypothetical protein
MGTDIGAGANRSVERQAMDLPQTRNRTTDGDLMGDPVPRQGGRRL